MENSNNININETNTVNTAGANTSQADAISIKDLLFVFLSNWYWFLLSVILCAAGAYLYLSTKAPIYRSEACLIIKQDRRSGSNGLDNSNTSFSNLGSLFAQQTNVFNEIVAFKSPDMMGDVVKRLDLRASYSTRHRLYDRALYGSSLPVTIAVEDFPAGASMGMTINYVDNESVELTQMFNYIAGQKVVYEAPIQAKFFEQIDTPVGKLTVHPNISFYDRPGSDKGFAPINMTYSPLASAVASYAARLNVDLTNKESTALTLNQVDFSPERARDILATLITVYNERWIGDRNQIAVSTSEFINDRLVVIERELGSVDRAVSEYKSTNKLLDPQMAGSLYLNQATKIQQDIIDLENRLGMARHVQAYMTSVSANNQLLPANSGIENSGIEQQISDYNTKQLQRNNLVANSSVDSPVVVDMDASLRAMRAAILASIDNYIITLNTQIKSLRSTEAQNSAKISVNPLQAEHLTDIERQQMVKESLYLYLLQKREENELSQAFAAYNTRVLTMPSPGDPIGPNRKRIMLIALLLGLAIPAGVLYLIIMLNTTVRGRKDIEAMKTPFIGEIPLDYEEAKKKKNKKGVADKKKILVKAGSRNMINEAYRVLRTNLEFVCGREGSHVLMTTSFNVGSGKTFTTVNTAAVLALKGKKVCAVDLDIRKHSLSNYLDNVTKGVVEYLAGKESNLDSLIVKEAFCTNLDILPAGTIPPNPTELLYSEKLEEMFAYLRSKYDYILIDCPPVEIVADAMIVNRFVDNTIFVVRKGLLERSLLPEIDKMYAEKRYNGMVILLNGSEVSGTSAYRYQYGYRHKGYGYSYGSYAYSYTFGSGKKHRKGDSYYGD